MWGSTDGLQCLVEGAHVIPVSIPLCPLCKSCPPISLHGPKLSLECTAGSLVCSFGSLLSSSFASRWLWQEHFFSSSSWISLCASSNHSLCFLVNRPTTSAVVSSSMVFIYFYCSSGSAAVTQWSLSSNMTWRLFFTLGSQRLCTCSFLQLMMVYHLIKFGCKKISSSVEMVETVIFDCVCPQCDWICRQQTNLLAWHSGPWWCTTVPNLVIEGSAVEEISSRWTLTGILTLTFTTTEKFNLFTRQSILWWCAIKPCLVVKGSADQKIY